MRNDSGNVNADFAHWRGLKEGAEAYGYSEGRAFQRPARAHHVIGARFDGQAYFCSSAWEILANRPTTFILPRDMAEGAIRVLSGFTSSAIQVAYQPGSVPSLVIRPVLSGAAVELRREASETSGGGQWLCFTFDQVLGRVYFSVGSYPQPVDHPVPHVGRLDIPVTQFAVVPSHKQSPVAQFLLQAEGITSVSHIGHG